MDKPVRKSLVVSVIVFIIVMGRLLSSNALATIRAVDALLLFAAGLSAGVVLVQILNMRKSSTDSA